MACRAATGAPAQPRGHARPNCRCGSASVCMLRPNLLAIAPTTWLGPIFMLQPIRESLEQLLLGTQPRLRRHLGRFLLSALVYSFSLLVQLQLTTWTRFVPLRWVLLYVAVVGSTVPGFYVLMRSGLSRRFADPAVQVVLRPSTLLRRASGTAGADSIALARMHGHVHRIALAICASLLTGRMARRPRPTTAPAHRCA